MMKGSRARTATLDTAARLGVWAMLAALSLALLFTGDLLLRNP